MKLKKLIATISTLAMLGSMAVAVPANAEEVTGDTGAVVANVSAQVRAKDSLFTEKNSVTIKTDGNGIEMTQKDGVYFGAYYSFEKPNIPAGATITSATLTITKFDAFKQRDFNVIALDITDATSTDGDVIFNAVSTKYNAENKTVVVAKETSATNEAPIVADVTSIYNSTKDIAFFVTNATVENSKRQLKPSATLQVVYSYNEPVATAEVDGVTTNYDSLEEAVTNADKDSTIILYKDVTLTKRLDIEKNLTITSDNKTITSALSDKPTVLAKSATVKIENTTITNTSTGGALQLEGGADVTISGGTINGLVYQSNGLGCSVILENATVNGNILTRYAKDRAYKTSCVISITNSTVTGTVTYDSTVDKYEADAASAVAEVVDANVIEIEAENIGEFEGTNDDSVATAFVAEMGDVTGTLNITVTSNGTEKTFESATTLTDANVVLGIIVDIYDALATAVITVQ